MYRNILYCGETVCYNQDPPGLDFKPGSRIGIGRDRAQNPGIRDKSGSGIGILHSYLKFQNQLFCQQNILHYRIKYYSDVVFKPVH